MTVVSRSESGLRGYHATLAKYGPALEQASADPRIARRLREISREFRSATEK